MIGTQRTLLSLFTLLAATVGQAAPLEIGDPAPPLHVSAWLNGEPIKHFEAGNTYVVELWAPWCRPCVNQIPHLSYLAQLFPEVRIVGVSVSEHEDTPTEPFVEKHRDEFRYAVAKDMPGDAEGGSTNDAYNKAAGINTIPTAYVIHDRKIAWVGTSSALKPVLDGLQNGTFDWARSRGAFEILRPHRLQAAIVAKDYDAALGIIDEMELAEPQFNVLGNRAMRYGLLIAKGERERAYLYLDLSMTLAQDDAIAVSHCAQLLARDPHLDANGHRKLTEYVERVLLLSNGDKAVRPHAAWIYAMAGRFDDAVRLQQEAVDAADASTLPELLITLHDYKKKRP